MTLRAWTNTLGGLFLICVYASIYNLIAPKGLTLYIMVGIGVLILWYIGLILYRSTDKRQIKLKLKMHKDQPDDIFSTKKYVLAKETSSRALASTSDIVRETYGKDEIVGMLDFVHNWKEKNGFEWGNTTVYDELSIEGELDTKVDYSITQLKYTKTFKIKGTLEVYDAEEDQKTGQNKDKGKDNGSSKDRDKVYTISGLTFYLSNVLPEDEGKMAVWSISVNTKNDRTDIGMLTGKEYL